MDLERRLAARLAFVARLYELTDGSRTRFVRMEEVIADLRYAPEEIASVVEYLQGEQLVDEVAGSVTITHIGVREVEQALSNPRQPTVHFPAAVNIINVEHMHGSQIQQGTATSTQFGDFVSGESREALKAEVNALRGDLAELVLADDDRSELEAEVGTVEQQLGSSRPKVLTIRGSLQRIGELLTSATVASGSAVQLSTHLETLHRMLPGI